MQKLGLLKKKTNTKTKTSTQNPNPTKPSNILFKAEIGGDQIISQKANDVSSDQINWHDRPATFFFVIIEDKYSKLFLVSLNHLHFFPFLESSNSLQQYIGK